MSGDLLKVMLVYATIPVYVVGLLILVACIARYQLQLSISQGIKRLLKSSAPPKEGQKRSAYPPVAYVFVLILSLLLIAIALLLEKGKRS